MLLKKTAKSTYNILQRCMNYFTYILFHISYTDRSQQMLTQFMSQTKILFARHFSPRETTLTHATVINLHQPAYLPSHSIHPSIHPTHSIRLSIYLSICPSVRPSIHLYIYVYSCCSHLEYTTSVNRSISLQFLNFRQSVGLLGRGISPS
jgi:hypothetical protein